MNEKTYNGEEYFDDRLFVLHLCKCTVSIVDEETQETIIHHTNAPEDFQWCVATYRNKEGYPILRVDHFRDHDEAETFLRETEPTVPLISLGGRSPLQRLSHSEFLEWKASNMLADYDYRTVYSDMGASPKEMVLSRRK